MSKYSLPFQPMYRTQLQHTSGHHRRKDSATAKVYVERSAVSTATNARRTTDLAWRILLIAVGHMLTSQGAGLILGRAFDIGASGISLLSGILIGITIGLAAVRI